jgi:hypothetical protein
LPTSIFPRKSKNVLPQRDESVPVAEPVQVGCCGKQITKEMMEVLAIEKYRANGKGITINDITSKYSVKKSKAQRSLKYFHSRDVLFTAQDLVREGIHLLQNKNPQEYFAACMKAEILESQKYVPNLLNWILKQCDLNKDVEIDYIAQLTLPDIQLKSADRIFRLYVKIKEGKADCRGEESLTLNQIVPEALDNIRHPYKSLEKKIDHVIQLLESGQYNSIKYILSYVV